MPTTLSGYFMLNRLAFFALFCLAGCYKHNLFIQQESIDANHLASVQVDTPDPRRENPPVGQKLLIAWDFPKSHFDRGLCFQATVRLWDNQEQIISLPIERKRDTTSLFFPAPNQILTYRIDIISADGRIVETWEHQFWTELIEIDETRASVSSHPKHGSVTETP